MMNLRNFFLSFTLAFTTATTDHQNLRSSLVSSFNDQINFDSSNIYDGLDHHDLMTVLKDSLDDIANNNDALQDPQHRDLQLELISTVCALIGTILPGDISCSCSVILGIEFACMANSPICVGGLAGFCAAPAISGSLNLLTTSVNFQFCANTATNGGVAVPGLCIDVGGGLSPDSLVEEEEIGTLDSCTASIDGKTCTCEICEDKKSYTFDCSEIDPVMVQSTCTELNIIQSLSPDQNIQFLPHLD